MLSRPIIRWLTQQRPPPPVPLSNFERLCQELKPCDVVLVEGRSRASAVVKTVTQSPWCHAALYVGRLYDIEDQEGRRLVREATDLPASERLVIESVLGEGCVVRPLSVYEDDHVRLCRPQGLSHPDAQQVLMHAAQQIGKGYDLTADIRPAALPAALGPDAAPLALKPVPPASRQADAHRLLNDDRGSLRRRAVPHPALVQQGEGDQLQLFRRNPKLCVPSDFDYSPYFQIIKYPFMDFSAHTGYRLLPWSSRTPTASLPNNSTAALEAPKED